MSYPRPDNEDKRLEALHRYHILDSAPEESFDDFVQIASFICDTPIALITLVDSTRQWFKARIGLEATETPREQAFCAYTILGEETMIVADATLDERFATNPLVTDSPNIRFYAGVPLIDHEGYALGSLCVIDRQPRQLTPGHYKTLEALSHKITLQLEMRRTADELATALSDIKTLHGLLPICPHCKGIRNDEGYWQSVESYINAHTEACLNQRVCPKCFQSHSLDLSPGD